MSKDYNATVNLPKTDFPMRASLPKREPDMLQAWNDMNLYEKMVARNEGKPSFILHDGPPFSNGSIHMGTAMNKCIKDFIVRYKNMSGWHAPYTPGWDNHGMPIESAIIKQQKLNRKAMKTSEFRTECQKFAEKYVNIQMDSFKRIGCLGDWDHPYLTMDPKFEAEELKVFGEMFEKGYIYKGKKPVYWCAECETALAEAEIEYENDPCRTIYVKFPVLDDHGKLSQYAPLDKIFFVIWTTTTWTLPANLAISLNGSFIYVLAQAPNGEVYILAKDLMDSVAKAAGIESFTVLAELTGAELDLMTAQHPFMNRPSVIICGDHVTAESGTGCVHTAPGHGVDDYNVCRAYEAKGVKIGMTVPVDDQGRMNEEAGKYNGLTLDEANKAIFADLEAAGYMLAWEDVVHQYPHCWRCHKPIVFRATDQWFCSIDGFREDAIKACDEVQWIPEWGHDRMVSMINERADWCISRQRNWGLPIPVLYCEECGEAICNHETIDNLSEIFRAKGSNAWWDMEADELVPAGFVCPKCGGKHFSKETSTLDGWFDSGSTHAASMELDSPGCWPSTMYFEGLDQYRGWFQSSLLTAVATKGKAPYKICMTHGWTVDGEGKAMHKSLGNGVYPEEVIPKYGADLLRLWAASADYHQDMRCSDAQFKQLSDMYLKIRNTARYILGNLNGFDPVANRVAYEDMLPLDRWAMVRLNDLIRRCTDAFEAYDFYIVTHSVHKFCIMEMSNFYLDIIKDRLYCDGVDSLSRRSAQTAIYEILSAITRLLAPILAFTTYEIWEAMNHGEGVNPEHVMLNDMPKYDPTRVFTEEEAEYWDKVMKLRGDVNKALELARAEKRVGKPLDAKVTLFVSGSAKETFAQIKDENFEQICIVSEAEIVDGEGEGYKGEQFAGLTVKVEPSEAPKCPRCWMHSNTVGSSEAHPALCARCAESLAE